MLENIQKCEIDDGVFKYILISIIFNNVEKFYVRGYKNCGYHADVFQRFIN